MSFSTLRVLFLGASHLSTYKRLSRLAVKWPIFRHPPRLSSTRSAFFTRCSAAFFSSKPNIFKDSLPMNCASKSPKLASENLADSSNDNPKIMAEKLADLTPEEAKRLKVLRLEYDVFFSTGVKVPDTVTDENWLTLLRKCTGVMSRKRYYLYLFKTERARMNEKKKRERNVKLSEERSEARRQEVLAEGPDALTFKNTYFLMLLEPTKHRHYYNNIFYSMMHGPHLVFDFRYESSMTSIELANLITQLQLCHSYNKVAREPFHFHFCNVPPNSETYAKLQAGFGNLESMPITVSEEHYEKLYPKERLVYLSPNAPTVMGNSFDVDDVYVVGAIVDKATEEPLTLATAKKEKIRTVHFPLDRHVRWVQGSKSLPLNHVVQIMLQFKTSLDWKQALVKSLPARKYSKD